MKKILAIAVVALFAALPASAQFSYGIKAGLNLSKVDFNKNSNLDRDNRTGFFFGPMVEFTIPIVGLGVDAALLYDNKQVNVEETNKTLHYIDVPINLKYAFGLGAMASVFVATGPQFAFNVGERNILNDEYRLKDSDFSWNVGVGAKLINHLQIAYNYNIGLGHTADVKDSASALAKARGKMKTNTHQISVAYIF